MGSAPAAADILLVEDDPDEVELALSALKKNGFTEAVFVARDGEEALDFLFAPETPGGGRPGAGALRLILLDMKLPKVDGLEVLRRVKADPRTRTLPVVVLTSSQEDRDVVESYRLGVNSYLVKPVSFDRFVEAVASLGHYWLRLNRLPG